MMTLLSFIIRKLWPEQAEVRSWKRIAILIVVFGAIVIALIIYLDLKSAPLD